MNNTRLLNHTDVSAKYHKIRAGTNIPEGRPTHTLAWLDTFEKLILTFLDLLFHKTPEDKYGETKEQGPPVGTQEKLDNTLCRINLMIEDLGQEVLAMIQPIQANLIYMYQHNYYMIEEEEALTAIEEFRAYVADPAHPQAAGFIRRTIKLVDFVDSVRKICDFLLENTGYMECGPSPRKILNKLQKNLESRVKSKRMSIPF